MLLRQVIKLLLKEDTPTFSTWNTSGYLQVTGISNWKADPNDYYEDEQKKDLMKQGIDLIFNKFGESETSRELSNELNSAIEDGDVNDIYAVKNFIEKHENN